MDVAGTTENINVVAECRGSTPSTPSIDDHYRTQIRGCRPHPQRVRPGGGRRQRVGGKVSDGESGPPPRAAPATTSTASAHRAPTSCSTARRTTRVRYHGRPERPARLGPGFQRVTSNFSRSTAAPPRRYRQRADQVGHQQLPRHRLRFLPQRQAGDQHLRQQGQRHREGGIQASPARIQRRRADSPRQDSFLQQHRAHPGPQRRHVDQLGADTAVHRGQRAATRDFFAPTAPA